MLYVGQRVVASWFGLFFSPPRYSSLSIYLSPGLTLRHSIFSCLPHSCFSNFLCTLLWSRALAYRLMYTYFDKYLLPFYLDPLLRISVVLPVTPFTLWSFCTRSLWSHFQKILACCIWFLLSLPCFVNVRSLVFAPTSHLLFVVLVSS